MHWLGSMLAWLVGGSLFCFNFFFFFSSISRGNKGLGWLSVRTLVPFFPFVSHFAVDHASHFLLLTLFHLLLPFYRVNFFFDSLFM